MIGVALNPLQSHLRSSSHGSSRSKHLVRLTLASNKVFFTKDKKDGNKNARFLVTLAENTTLSQVRLEPVEGEKTAEGGD